MDLIKKIYDEKEKRFDADSILDGIENHIQRFAIRQIDEKYKDTIYKKGGYTYKFQKSHAWLDLSGNDIKLAEVRCTLLFVITSTLTTEQKKVLKQNVNNFYRDGIVDSWYNGKLKLWQELTYDVEIKNVIDNEINLEIS